MIIRVVIVLAMIFVVPSAHVQESGVIHLTPPSGEVPPSFFGMHIHRPAEATWPQVPFAEWRLWDTRGTIWYDLEPRRGQWNWKQLDDDIALAEKHHVGVLLTLGQSPAWATSRPHDPPRWRAGGAAPPKDEEDWKNYVRTVATRYRGRIHEYEVWNEPDVKDSYTGTLDQLVVLSKDAYETIHSVDPTAMVVSPAIEGDFGVPWLDRYLRLGGGNYADVIGYHFYTRKPPEYAAEIIRQVKNTLHAHNVDKPIWNTESGYGSHSEFENPRSPDGSEQHVLPSNDFLAYVMREDILNWASGVTRLYWYDWDSNLNGLGDNLGTQKKPGAYGYMAVHQWLLGATLKSCEQDAQRSWTCELKRGARSEWIVWNPDGSVPKTIPTSWKVTRLETLSENGEMISSRIDRKLTIMDGPIPTLLH
jgi:Glycosyl hydrolases family 39